LSGPSDLVQGTLELLMLKILALEPLNGFAISQRLRQVSSDATGERRLALSRGVQARTARVDHGRVENGRRTTPSKVLLADAAGATATGERVGQLGPLVILDFVVGETQGCVMFPRWFCIARLRLRSLFQRDRIEAELAEDIPFHLEQRERDLARQIPRYIRHYNNVAKPIRWSSRDPSRRITDSTSVSTGP
jgi:hypothetical protein